MLAIAGEAGARLHVPVVGKQVKVCVAPWHITGAPPISDGNALMVNGVVTAHPVTGMVYDITIVPDEVPEVMIPDVLPIVAMVGDAAVLHVPVGVAS